MEQLKVIGTEDDVLVLVTESGDRFSLAVDDVLRVELRKARREREGESQVVRPSPREIQAHIRAGLSADEVAALLGARLEDIARFEGPVLAEREHVVGQALAVPVLLGAELDPDVHPTFGGAVRAKLAEAGASGERWTSWKEATGWVVKLEFTARRRRPRCAMGLRPASQHALALELRCDPTVAPGFAARRSHPAPARTRLGPRQGRHPLRQRCLRPASPAGGRPRVTGSSRAGRSRRAGGCNEARDGAPPVTSSETADLLEALRRRRGQREPLPGTDELASSRTHAPVALFDALEPGYDETPRDARRPTPDRRRSGRGRRGSRSPKGSHLDAVVGRDRLRGAHRGVTRVRRTRRAG